MTKKEYRRYEGKYRRQRRIDARVRLHKASACALCDELEKREGVTWRVVEPYEKHTVTVEGPAILYTVID